MRNRFRERRIPGLFYSADNLQCVAGHKRVFGSNPGRGMTIFRYNQFASHHALHRVWSIGLVALHHVGEGLSTTSPGWHWTFAGLQFERLHHGFSVKWHLADLYHIPPKKVKSHGRTISRR